MKYYKLQMEMFGWADGDIGIFGGTRADGFHPSGHLWCNFMIYDMAHKVATGEDRLVGRMKLLVKFVDTASGRPEITKIVNLEIEAGMRRNPRKGQPGEGLGRRAVKALRRIIATDIEVCDIKKSAVGFWRKVGVEPIVRMGQIDGILAPLPSVDAEVTHAM